MADSGLLERVLANLIDNVIKAAADIIIIAALTIPAIVKTKYFQQDVIFLVVFSYQL